MNVKNNCTTVISTMCNFNASVTSREVAMSRLGLVWAGNGLLVRCLTSHPTSFLARLKPFSRRDQA